MSKKVKIMCPVCLGGKHKRRRADGTVIKCSCDNGVITRTVTTPGEYIKKKLKYKNN